MIEGGREEPGAAAARAREGSQPARQPHYEPAGGQVPGRVGGTRSAANTAAGAERGTNRGCTSTRSDSASVTVARAADENDEDGEKIEDGLDEGEDTAPQLDRPGEGVADAPEGGGGGGGRHPNTGHGRRSAGPGG